MLLYAPVMRVCIRIVFARLVAYCYFYTSIPYIAPVPLQRGQGNIEHLTFFRLECLPCQMLLWRRKLAWQTVWQIHSNGGIRQNSPDMLYRFLAENPGQCAVARRTSRFKSLDSLIKNTRWSSG